MDENLENDDGLLVYLDVSTLFYILNKSKKGESYSHFESKLLAIKTFYKKRINKKDKSTDGKISLLHIKL